jgi:hypothetical protein
VFEGSSEPVEAPDDQGITRTDVVDGFFESRALGFGSTCGVGEDLGTAGFLKGVFLKVYCFGLWLIRGRSLLTYGFKR